MTLLAHSLHSACTALAQRFHTVCTWFLGLRDRDTDGQQRNMDNHLPNLPSPPSVLVHMHVFLFFNLPLAAEALYIVVRVDVLADFPEAATKLCNRLVPRLTCLRHRLAPPPPPHGGRGGGGGSPPPRPPNPPTRPQPPAPAPEKKEGGGAR